jgi:hypothetical protein
MLVPGESPPEGDVSQEFVVTHELGHHLAANRSNHPWRAFDTGPKRWATYERVCDHMGAGRLSTDDYASDPGEGFAQAYALYHYRQAPWGIYSELLRPDGEASTRSSGTCASPGSGVPARRFTDASAAAALDARGPSRCPRRWTGRPRSR